jgi:hypothetical protein
VAGGSDKGAELPLVPSDQGIDKLKAVDEQSLLKSMMHHLDAYFPDWAPVSGRVKRSELLDQLLARARNNGYTFERAQAQWTNVFGYSGNLKKVDDLSPRIMALLASPPKEVDSERLAREAATIACHAAMALNH